MTELKFLTAAAVAGVVAAGGFLDPDGNLDNLLGFVHRLFVDESTGGTFGHSGLPQRLRALDGAFRG